MTNTSFIRFAASAVLLIDLLIVSSAALIEDPYSFDIISYQTKGKYIAIDVWIHTLFHLLRWGTQGNIDLLWTNATGLSGLIVVLVCPLITFPMFIPQLRLSMSYEVRKSMHYLFYVFAIGMCFHNRTSAFPNGGFNQVVLGFCITYYTLDSLYVMFFMTEIIETTIFNVLPR